MTKPNSCGVCDESFQSDRDLQEHQESAHPEKDGNVPDTERSYGHGKQETERIT
jgi:hypothetical protein